MPDPTPSDCGATGPAAKRRRFLQVHLSTLVVLMFVVGGLVWANVHRRNVSAVHECGTECAYLVYGWPSQMIVVNLQSYHTFEGLESWFNGGIPARFYWRYAEAVLNIAVGACITVAIGISSEWFIRRRERQQP
jgi:hypothetical protein